MSLGALAAPLLAGMAVSNGETPLSLLDPTAGALSVATAIPSFFSNLNNWIGQPGGNGARVVILLVGIILIAAGVFSHPAVREKVSSVAKKAGEVAAIAA
jgi:hypothetical protein